MRLKKINNQKAQTAIEYLILLGVVVAIILTAVPWFFPVTENATDEYYNRVGIGIVGELPP